MVFNSYEFLVFFPIVILIYFLIPRNVKNIWLLISSYYFYMAWNPKYALLLLLLTIVTYLSGIFIEKYFYSVKRKKLFVGYTFFISLSILFLFKYLEFIVANINIFLNKIGIEIISQSFDLILPLGISFYTFQALTYTVDVYKGNIKAENNFLKYALFVSFFPQVVSGPIEKSRNLLPQFNEEVKFEFDRVKSGLLLMTWGFLQKLVIADQLGIIINNVYGNYTKFTGFHFIVATICYSIQVYVDFSSYTDIARGAARILGFKLSPNFLRPYFSKSIGEFWRRWHITLGAWLREYIYIPLGGNRKGTIIKYRNILIVFLISGIWHGASWGFVIWGALHGLYQIIGDILMPIRTKVKSILKVNEKSFSYKLFQIIVVYLLVTFAWIFFRASSITEAIYIINKIFTFDTINKIFEFDIISVFTISTSTLNISYLDVFYMLYSVMIFIIVSLLRRNISLEKVIAEQHFLFRYSLYTFSIVVIIFYMVSGQSSVNSSFIYFQF